MCGNSLLSVEKTLFNEQLFRQLEETKVAYFGETSKEGKAKLKKEIEETINKLTGGTDIFDFQIHFSEVFHRSGGFDVFVANPPYVGHKGGHKLFFNEMKPTSLGIRFNNERMDLFYYFFHLAIDLSRNDGVVSFITTNYYVTADSAIKLRRDFRDRTTLLAMVNFGELKIFESALGQHNMTTVLMKTESRTRDCRIAVTRRTGFAAPDVLRRVLQGNDSETLYRSVSQEALYEGSLLYISCVNAGVTTSNEIEQLLGKLRVQHTVLARFCNVDQGIVTGLDRVSPKHLRRLPKAHLIVGQGCYVLSQSERLQLVNGTNNIDQIIKPWFKNSDIQRYVTKCDNSEWVIHATLDCDIKKYQAVYEHLLALKKAIQSRNYDSGELSKALKLGSWWALSSARKDFDFSVPKIVAPQRSHENMFGYNEVTWCASADVYYITQKDSDIALKYVLALLNSKLYFVWLYFKGKRKGEMLELYQKPLSEIPIKQISSREQAMFVVLVDRILDSKRVDPAADTTLLEQEIDRLVYDLYGLAPAEVKLVEEMAARRHGRSTRAAKASI